MPARPGRQLRELSLRQPPSAPANWMPIYTNTADGNGLMQFTDQLATNFLRRFYRAVYP